MKSAKPALKAAAGAMLLVLAGSSTGRSDIKPPAPNSPKPAVLQAIVGQLGSEPVVERLPKSYLAWGFAKESDGTQVITGPSGVIWHGQVDLSTGPYTPSLQNLLNKKNLPVFPPVSGKNPAGEAPPEAHALPPAPTSGSAKP